MGRPKKYFSEEERKAANRESNRRWLERNRDYNKKRKEENREAHLRYYESHKKELKEKWKVWRKKNQAYVRETRRKNPLTVEKARVYGMVYRAIEKGQIQKSPCQVCGKEEVEAHHSDYNKPLDVMWLCKSCHVEWHRNNKAIEPESIKC